MSQRNFIVILGVGGIVFVGAATYFSSVDVQRFSQKGMMGQKTFLSSLSQEAQKPMTDSPDSNGEGLPEGGNIYKNDSFGFEFQYPKE